MTQDGAAMETKTLGSIDIQRILELLPHRYPFLLVDRIIEMEGALSCIGIKNVTANEPQFTGHFPGQPTFPGVLMIEGMAQTAGALVVSSNPDVTRGVKHVLFTTIDNAKFRKPVIPGDQIRYHMTRVAQKRGIWWFRGEAKVDGVLVAEANISAMVVMN